MLNIGLSRSLGILYGTASIAVFLSILLIDTGIVLCECDDCVRNAVTIVENLL